jgi:hypothetical protein
VTQVKSNGADNTDLARLRPGHWIPIDCALALLLYDAHHTVAGVLLLAIAIKGAAAMLPDFARLLRDHQKVK